MREYVSAHPFPYVQDGLDPETTLGEKHQMEALLLARLKALEADLSDARRALREAKRDEAAAREAAAALQVRLACPWLGPI